MKTEREIRDKINELMDQASECIDWENVYQDKELKESICSKIHALLWVIGDCSGLSI